MTKENFIKLHISVLENKEFTLVDKMVYSILLNRFEYHKQPFYCYEKYLTELLGADIRIVRRSINKLKKLELITTKREWNPDIKKTVNMYTHVKSPNEIDQEKQFN